MPSPTCSSNSSKSEGGSAPALPNVSVPVEFNDDEIPRYVQTPINLPDSMRSVITFDTDASIKKAKSSSPSHPTATAIPITTESIASTGDNVENKISESEIRQTHRRSSALSAIVIHDESNAQYPPTVTIPAFAIEMFNDNPNSLYSFWRPQICCKLLILFIVLGIVVVAGFIGAFLGGATEISRPLPSLQKPNLSPTLSPLPTSSPIVNSICESSTYSDTNTLNRMKLSQRCRLPVCSGNCEHDSDCVPGLLCTNDTYIFGSGYNSRRENEIIPGCLGEPKPYTKYCIRPICEDSDAENYGSVGNILYFGRARKCLLKECSGDCKGDMHCAPGLKCYKRSQLDNSPPGCTGKLNSWNLCYNPKDS